MRIAAVSVFPVMVALATVAAPLAAQRPSDPPGAPDPLAAPFNGPRQVDINWVVLRGATLHASPGAAAIEGATIEVRDGRIVAVGGPYAVATPGARVVERTGLHVYAGFLEPYVDVETPVPEAASAGMHWNSRVTPQRMALDGAGPDQATREALRKLGFCAAAIAPRGGIFRGQSALVPLIDPPPNRPPGPADAYVAALYHVVGFDAGRERAPRGANAPAETAADVARWDRYPGSLMGTIALMRQTFADAQWWNPPGRPDGALPLSSLEALRAPPRLMLFDAQDELDLLRAAKVHAEFPNFDPVMLGCGFEFRRLEAIAALGCPLILPVQFPQKPRVASVGEAEAVDLRELMVWEQAPTNPRRLDAKGVKVALTSSKARDRSKFHESLREAIRHGLAEDRALAMLTTHPAQILGVPDFGTVAPGSVANFVLTDGPLFAKDTKIVEVWIDGVPVEIAAPADPARGVWDVTLDPPLASGFRLTIGASGRVRAGTGDSLKRASESSVARDRITFVTDAEIGEARGLSTWTGLVQGDAMAGTGVLADGSTFRFTATRRPGADTRPADDEDDKAESRPDSRRAEGPPQVPEAFGLPFGPYAREAPPEQPASVLIQGGTIWTSGAEGIIENGWVLVAGGRVTAVGRGSPPATPAGTVVVDARGKHVTPGLIDCHSHTGISRGVNESGQAVTAEVRIADVTDPDSIAWYRQLAAGITTVNNLHGSANAIGGQNCVNKVRWGVTHPDAMHFEDAPAGIKFALGENPKQSNWGDRATTRYPQTRMGVEALIRDRFTAAREYAAAWERFRAAGAGAREPRRDLELEALAEILAGTRLVHCHSYRQDEILMLCRIAKEFGFRIGTFQHVLEGYKVADEIKEAAIGASSFADWWAYKVEVQDAIPHNGPIMHEVGVLVSYNSDSDEMARRMNVEAAKAVKYGPIPPAEALKFVTLNAARQLRIDARVGSLEAGKDADFVVWSHDPLSTRARCEQTWIDGRRYFSLEEDAEARRHIIAERQRIIQKLLDAGGRDRNPSADAATDRGRGRRGRPGEDEGELWDWDWFRGGPDGLKPGDCGCGGGHEHEEGR